MDKNTIDTFIFMIELQMKDPGKINPEHTETLILQKLLDGFPPLESHPKIVNNLLNMVNTNSNLRSDLRTAFEKIVETVDIHDGKQ